MKTKKSFIALLVATGALAVSGFAFATLRNGTLGIRVHGDPKSYTTTLSSTNRPAELTASFQNSFSGNVKTAIDNNLNFTFVNARSYEGLFAQLASHGKIYNYATGNSETRGLNGVTFEGQGTLLFKPAIKYGDKGAAIYPEIEPVSIAANAGKVTVPTCDYFEIEAADGGAAIQNLTFTYSCETEGILDIKMLNGTFTGKGQDGFTWKLVVENGQVAISKLDDPSAPLNLSGSVTMLTKTRAKCTFVYMTKNVFYVMDYDGHQFNFVEKSDDAGGMIANAVTQINHLYRVYNVEDFESYSETGQGYVDSNKKYQTTGLRANYYADFWTGSGTGEIGGSGWPIMTSADNSNLFTTGGHNNSKTGVFKFSYDKSMRYISMNELYGVQHAVGKGTTLRFWTHGAYKIENSQYVNYTANLSMSVYLYYTSPIGPSTQSNRETFDFVCHQGNAWEEHEFTLNTDGRVYYGIGIYCKNTVGNTPYVPFDDFQIYNYDPDTVYTAVTGVSLNKNSTEITAGQTETLVATIAPQKATDQQLTWTSSNDEVATVDAQGVVTAVKAGSATITVKTHEGNFTDTCEVTVNPAVLLDYPEGTYVAIATIFGSSWKLALAIGNASNGLINVRVSNKDMHADSITYNQQTRAITIPTSGSFEMEIQGKNETISIGTVTGVYDPEHCKITNIHVEGTVENYVSNNGSLEATMPQTYYDCDGTTEQLQATFKRRYMSGSWQVDTDNASRYERDTEHFVSGTGAMKRKGWTGGAVATNLNVDFNPARSLENIGFWVYNPTANKIEISQWIYKASNLGSNEQIGSVYAEPNTWSYCVMGFGQKTIYNFQIADFTNSGAAFTFDNIVLF